MKSVLISIQPQWVEKIASGEKTIEVRKTAPKCETPFKCYIYMTQGKLKDLGIYSEWVYKNRMKVIGEFVCDKVICSQAYFDSQGKNHLTNVFPDDIKKTCLDEYDLWDYIAGKAVKANQMYDGYLWHISDLKIYDTPKELSEFSRPCSYSGLCFSCKRTSFKKDGNLLCNTKITRPPQSWMYVEELQEKQK